MSSTHTPGRISSAHWNDDAAELEGWTLVSGQHRLPLCSAECEDAAEAEANARRLVACWNAFDGIDTDFIDAMAPNNRLDAMARMQDLVDALAKTETYLIERLASNPGSTGATVILPMIRRALEGAHVAPTPSSWGDV